MSFTAAHAQHSASIELDGNWYLQSGVVTNTTANATLNKVVYSLGALEEGVAVFELYLSTGQHQDFVPAISSHYSTEVYDNLNLGYGQSFTFSGLDIDLYKPSMPGVFDHANLDTVGTSLKNATVSFLFSDGFSTVLELNETKWHTTQVLSFPTVSPVPEPETFALFALGGLLVFAKRHKQK
jgi:hypothetical protein